MSTHSFEYEKRSWEFDVEEEAAELVRRGVPPYQAIQQATRIVQERRSGNLPERTSK